MTMIWFKLIRFISLYFIPDKVQTHNFAKAEPDRQVIVGVVDWGDMANPWEARYLKYCSSYITAKLYNYPVCYMFLLKFECFVCFFRRRGYIYSKHDNLGINGEFDWYLILIIIHINIFYESILINISSQHIKILLNSNRRSEPSNRRPTAIYRLTTILRHTSRISRSCLQHS